MFPILPGGSLTVFSGGCNTRNPNSVFYGGGATIAYPLRAVPAISASRVRDHRRPVPLPSKKLHDQGKTYVLSPIPTRPRLEIHPDGVFELSGTVPAANE